MDNVGFDAGRWNHWLLVVSFAGVASYGLWLSWQWRLERYQERLRSRQIHASHFSREQASRLSRGNALRARSARQLAGQAKPRQLVRHAGAQRQNHHAP